MDKEWTQANKADKPNNNFPTLHTYAHANGTGPFQANYYKYNFLSEFKRFKGHWNKNLPTNLDMVIFRPIAKDEVQIISLLTNKINLTFPVPLKHQKRIQKASKVKILNSPEIRTIFLGMDQWRSALIHSNIKSNNPFKSRLVREAIVRAIDTKAINSQLMLSTATPNGSLISNMYLVGIRR